MICLYGLSKGYASKSFESWSDLEKFESTECVISRQLKTQYSVKLFFEGEGNALSSYKSINTNEDLVNLSADDNVHINTSIVTDKDFNLKCRNLFISSGSIKASKINLNVNSLLIFDETQIEPVLTLKQSEINDSNSNNLIDLSASQKNVRQMVLENQTNGSLFADDDIMIKAKNDIIFIGNIIYSNKDTDIEANNICSIERAKIVTVSEKIVKSNIDESTVSIDRILQTQEIAGAPIIIMNGSDTRIMAQNGYRSFGSQISECNLYIKTIDGDIIKSGLALKNIVTTSTKTFTRIN